LRCETFLLSGRILCATGPWRYAKISLSLFIYIYRERERGSEKYQDVESRSIFKFSIPMIIDDWEQECQIWQGGELYIYTYTLYTKYYF